MGDKSMTDGWLTSPASPTFFDSYFPQTRASVEKIVSTGQAFAAHAPAHLWYAPSAPTPGVLQPFPRG